MSADNGIYIAKFPDGYRVIEAMAIENINYYPKDSPEYLNELKQYFGNAEVYDSRAEALVAAGEMEDKILSSNYPVLEYGISYIGEYPGFDEQSAIKRDVEEDDHIHEEMVKIATKFGYNINPKLWTWIPIDIMKLIEYIYHYPDRYERWEKLYGECPTCKCLRPNKDEMCIFCGSKVILSDSAKAAWKEWKDGRVV